MVVERDGEEGVVMKGLSFCWNGSSGSANGFVYGISGCCCCSLYSSSSSSSSSSLGGWNTLKSAVSESEDESTGVGDRER